MSDRKTADHLPPNYNPADYERPSVTVDVVIFTLVDDDLKVLLIKRKNPPYANVWAIPGGFVRIEESLEEAAARELAEETAVTNVYMEQLYTFGAPDRDPRTRVITVAYFALVPYDAADHRPGDDAAETGWWSMFDLPELAFDHDQILQYALTRLRYKLEYTSVGFRLLPDMFTLSDLQQAYETILGEDLDKRNFRRKILGAGILEETGQKDRRGEGRPAMLYCYREDATTEVKTRRLFP
ncbi:MAG: NUDIX domain-containing protein [Chloroflexota bacterium]